MNATLQYHKKEHHCMDGWIKEAETALVVVEGMKRDGHMHANLKNYVLPLQDNEEESIQQYEKLKLVTKTTTEVCMEVSEMVTERSSIGGV